MSEQRRATLTPFGKSDKKSSKSPQKTVRLTFTLSDPNENSCPVFDYVAAVKTEERKKLKKHREEKDKKPNGCLDPFEDNDEDVKRIARQFEAKYGDRKKLKSYAELGAGYDETDPFIDNTDAYDETLQEDQETAWGGYYINSGPLELKRVEVSDQSDADEVKKRGRKRSLPVIDEEEDEEEEDDEEDKECEEEEAEKEADENGEVEEAKPVFENGPPEPKKTKLEEERPELEKPPTPSYNGVSEHLSVKKKKKKRMVIEDDTDETGSKNKKAKTVKALLEEKRIQEQPVKAQEEPKRQVASETSIAEAIESVVNAGHNHDENSNSSTSSHSAPTGSSSASEDSQDGKPSASPPPLPENLLPEITTLVEQIKQTASTTDNTRKTFHPDINTCLIRLEWKTREFSAANRNMLFAHLAHHMPCTKDTLMRRAKKLFLDREESQIDNIVCKLKATIDATMPTILEKYQKDCQKIAEEKGIPANDNTPGGDNQTPSPGDAKMPKRKFPWTDETRGYLLSIIKCKQRCYKVCKPRKSTWEDYLKTFLHSAIRPLWPPGWMKTSALNKEFSRSPSKSKSSSHHLGKVDLSRTPSNASSSTNNGLVNATPCGDSSQSSTPLAAKAGADPINLLSKITSSFTPTSHKKSPHPIEKPEFSMDCLLKRTSESIPDYNTTLIDLMKNDTSLVNGLSLPLNVNNQNKNDKILDLSSVSVSSSNVTTSVIQSTSERTGDSSVRVSASEKAFNHTSPSGKEAMSHVPLNRKQRLLQSPEYNRNCESYDSVIKQTDTRYQSQGTEKSKCNSGGAVAVSEKPPPRERDTDKETTTATDILSQIISESLMSPPQVPYNQPPVKPKEEVKNQGVLKDQELLYDVMQDLKELNHLSSGGRDTKSTSFTGASWSYPAKSLDTPKTTPYHAEYLNYLQHSGTPKDTHATPPSPQLPYSRHNTSPYDNSAYVNEVSKSLYSHPSHRSNQSLPSLPSTPTNKSSHMNQMKNHPNTGISTGSESQSQSHQ
ncbi:ubinuclein-2-like isoform X2 [Macrosteles quadrilineatus]|uniref:ubinuclein-2-like isoform X2 n=1 Tax=Macrosteles quadrilineatus TaxID=74068 RepID=UPI0023E169D6|nr:ubinuclein-2-like isoform X2 [Macrosteles quadrilineatus]